jgi:hypothetical protein
MRERWYAAPTPVIPEPTTQTSASWTSPPALPNSASGFASGVPCVQKARVGFATGRPGGRDGANGACRRSASGDQGEESEGKIRLKTSTRALGMCMVDAEWSSGSWSEARAASQALHACVTQAGFAELCHTGEQKSARVCKTCYRTFEPVRAFYTTGAGPENILAKTKLNYAAARSRLRTASPPVPKGWGLQ